MLDIVIPSLNEGDPLKSVIEHLLTLPGVDQVIVVDASNGSADLEMLAEIESDGRLALITAITKGRAAQMNQGAQHCRQDVLLFLHGDTRLPGNAANLIQNALKTHRWGRFDLRLDSVGFRFRIIETMIKVRSRLTGIATGDQGIFVEKQLFEEEGGFANLELMEDIDFSKRYGKRHPPALIKSPVITSARRWIRDGTIRTILLMWKLRFLYWIGVNPARLAIKYRSQE